MEQADRSIAVATEKLKRKVELELYELHFHYRAHYFSAGHYENLDRRMTQWKIICSAVCLASGGSTLPKMLSSGQSNVGSQGLVFLTIASFCGYAVTELYRTQHSPARKQKLHHAAASRMKILRRKGEAWLETLDVQRGGGGGGGGDASQQVSLTLQEYNRTLDEHGKIEEDLVNSEDWVFSRVHRTLPEKWVKKGKELGKFSPRPGSGEWVYYWNLAEPYVIMSTWTLLASFGIWKFVNVTFVDSLTTN